MSLQTTSVVQVKQSSQGVFGRVHYLLLRHLACWFILATSRLSLKVKVIGQSSCSQDETSLATAGVADRSVAKAENEYY